MGVQLINASILTLIYLAFAAYLKFTLKDEMTVLLQLYLMIGIPLVISYFLLVVLYFKANRKVFWSVLGLLVLIGAGIVLGDLLTSNV
ncbi:hypothetical protein JJB07_20940 [Tumebacillus sp. ITR2]|uniref:Uncharacterized protein n=1 Tax=Tumebacillus amylolyticus TaxID=2801339 RepID=A0ABS1JFJ7_9BACL|nr:hypothetical protein [Tumebacillus amylolyticus]MBL0389063.1 hypothetical protein [Tumebacillus amylolyticus]